MSVFVTLSLFTNKGTMMTEKQKRIQCKEDGCRKLADPCHFICDMHLRESLKSDDDEEDDEDEEDEPKEPVIDPQAIMLKVQAGEAVEADLIVPLLKEYYRHLVELGLSLKNFVLNVNIFRRKLYFLK